MWSIVFERLFAVQAMFIPDHGHSVFAGFDGKHKKINAWHTDINARRISSLASSQFRTVLAVIKLQDVFLYKEQCDAIHSKVHTRKIVQPQQLEK